MEAIRAPGSDEIVESIRFVEQQVTWGRVSKVRLRNNVGAAVLVVLAPLWVHINWVALQYFNGSLTPTVRTFASKGLIQFAWRYFPQPSLLACFGYAGWLLFQALLYGYLPGPKCFGQRTPGGHLLSYTTNGLMAWTITHLLFLTASVLGLLDPAVIAKNWEGLFVAANTYGFVLAILAQYKGYWAPSYPEDRKMSGVFPSDLFSNILFADTS